MSLSRSLGSSSGTVSNNFRINGVEHFYQPTKPTTRGDLTALAIGDKWSKTDDGTEWFWNGTYWLSSVRNFFTGATSFAGGTSSTLTPIEYLPVNRYTGYVYFFLETVTRYCSFYGDVSNYWTMSVDLTQANGGAGGNIVPAINLQSITNHGVQSPNVVISGNGLTYQPRSIIATFLKVGAAANIVGISVTFAGRNIYP